MKKYLKTIILSVMFIGLLIFVIFSYSKSTKKDEAKVLFETNKTDISSVIFNKVEFKMINDSYAMFIPEEVPADSNVIQEFVNRCSKIEYMSIISKDGQNLSEFGLENPSKLITINKNNGNKFSFSIGDKTPSEDGYYIKDDKNQVYKISSDLGSTFEKTQDDFINKSITKFDMDKTDKIVYVINNAEYVLARVNNVWQINNIPLDKNISTQLIDKIQTITVDGLLPKENYVVPPNYDFKAFVYSGGTELLNIMAVKINDNQYLITKLGINAQYYITSEHFETIKTDILNLFGQANIQ